MFAVSGIIRADVFPEGRDVFGEAQESKTSRLVSSSPWKSPPCKRKKGDAGGKLCFKTPQISFFHPLRWFVGRELKNKKKSHGLRLFTRPPDRIHLISPPFAARGYKISLLEGNWIKLQSRCLEVVGQTHRRSLRGFFFFLLGTAAGSFTFAHINVRVVFAVSGPRDGEKLMWR